MNVKLLNGFRRPTDRPFVEISEQIELVSIEIRDHIHIKYHSLTQPFFSVPIVFVSFAIRLIRFNRYLSLSVRSGLESTLNRTQRRSDATIYNAHRHHTYETSIQSRLLKGQHLCSLCRSVKQPTVTPTVKKQLLPSITQMAQQQAATTPINVITVR